MFGKSLVRSAVALQACVAVVALAASPSQAIPLFAQRYRLSCTTCHTVFPELNKFGNYFRDHGYRIPNVPRHGTTGVALRYQMEWEREPPAGQRRWSPGGILLSNADIGAVAAFLHYNLGAGGGPGAVYLGYLAHYDEHTKSLFRAGFLELPLVQSPGQRLDDLAPYGYYQTRVGLNDLTLAQPRIGIQNERTIGKVVLDGTLAISDYNGSAYGGKPLQTGVSTYQSLPEVGLFARVPVAANVDVTAHGLLGQRGIGVGGQATFQDEYQRYAIGVHARARKYDLLAEQSFGFDGDIDGAGHSAASGGGFVRLKYYPEPNAYVGIRYDASANPIISRDAVYYIGTRITPYVRLVVQDVHLIGSNRDSLGGALTLGFPWPLNI